MTTIEEFDGIRDSKLIDALERAQQMADDVSVIEKQAISNALMTHPVSRFVLHARVQSTLYKLGDMRVGGFRVIAITNITDSCYYTHNPSLSSWRRTSEKSKRS